VSDIGRRIPASSIVAAVTPPTVPRIRRLTGREHPGADGERFALLHVVSGERHHFGWFQLSEDAWRVGLVDAAAVVEAGVPAPDVRRDGAAALAALSAAQDAGEVDVPEPVGPITDVLRFRSDRRAAIGRLDAELAEIP
jgi:hypothetical protein